MASEISADHWPSKGTILPLTGASPPTTSGGPDGEIALPYKPYYHPPAIKLMSQEMKNYLLLSTVALAFSASVASAEVRIATVDVARIVNDSPEAVAKKKDLENFSNETKKKIESKGKELQAIKTKLEEAKVAPDSKEADNFRNQVRDFERMRGDAKADLEKRYLKVNKELTDKVYAQIEKFAKANNYDLIMDKSEKYRGPILFGAPATDVTDELLKSSR